jgi:hypothetical protein
LAGLIENGVNPEALAAVVKELKRETAALKVIQRVAKSLILALNCASFCLRLRQDSSDFENSNGGEFYIKQYMPSFQLFMCF